MEVEEAGEAEAPSCCDIQSPNEACDCRDQGAASMGSLLRLLLRAIHRGGGADSTTAAVREESDREGEEAAKDGHEDEDELSGAVATMAQTVAITGRSPTAAEKAAVQAAVAAAEDSDGAEEESGSVPSLSAPVGCRRFLARPTST